MKLSITSAFSLSNLKLCVILSFIFFSSPCCAPTVTTTLPAVGTKEIIEKIDGIDIQCVVQGLSAQDTPLQVACLFEYVEGDIFTSPPALPKELNGMVHLDEALNGLITELRKSSKFEGIRLETLLIIPPANTIPTIVENEGACI